MSTDVTAKSPAPAPPGGTGSATGGNLLQLMLDGLRRMAPRELEDQVTNLIREFLLTLRALIDWYLERLDRPRQEPKIEDIPIE